MNAVNFFLNASSRTFMIGFFHIKHISSLGGPTFGLCSAWRYGAFWRFYFRQKLVMYIVTQVIKINVTLRTQDMREPPAPAHLGKQWLVK